MATDFDDALFLPKLNNPSEYNINFFEGMFQHENKEFE